MEKRTKKGAQLSATQVMRLEFFAKRFNVEKKLLHWGLIVCENEDAEVETFAVILINGKENIFIDIMHDRFAPKMNQCACKCTAYIATFNRVKGGYKFVAGDESKFLSNEDIEKTYCSK